jgi:Secretion system C-terminal sorting domain
MATVTNPTSAQATCSLHGVAWLYKSTISNAYTAMFNYKPIYLNSPIPEFFGYSGGILIAHESKFINNRRSVELSSFGGADESRFIDCDFIADKYLNDYPAETPVNLFVYAYDVKDVEFRNCKFNNVQSPKHTTKVQNWPTAIYGFDAGLNIMSNEFNNMCYGMWLDFPQGGWNIPIIRDNTLNKVYRGMYVSGCVQPHIIYNNTIHLTYCEECVDPCEFNENNRAVGIYLDNTTAQYVFENKIDYNTVDYTSHPNDVSWGIILQNMNENSTKPINPKRNIITNLYYGMTFLGRDNYVQPQCNYFDNPIPPPNGKHFTNFYAPLSINEWCGENPGTVLPSVMGSCLDGFQARKNRFSDCIYSLDRFYTHPTVPAIKYYSVYNAPFKPALCMTSTQVTNVVCDLPCLDFEECCLFLNYPYKDTLSKTGHLLAFDALKINKENKENIIDDDKTNILLATIADNGNNAQTVKIALVDVGAYLSDVVLLATITRSISPLSNYDLKNIMIANSPLSETVYNILDAIRPVVANNYMVWYAQQNAASPREILESEIKDIEQSIADKTQIITDKYVEENNKDAAINFLLLNNEVRMAIPIMIEKGDYTNALSFINAMPNAAERAIGNIVVNHKSTHTPLTTLTIADSTLLDSLANGDSKTAVYAQSIMKLACNKQYNKKLPTSTAASSNRKKQRVIDYTEILPEQLLYIYPNPTTNILHVVNYDKTLNNTFIQITDVLGKIVYEQTNNSYTQETIIATTNFIAGTYYIKIFDNLKNQKLNEKFIVIKE